MQKSQLKKGKSFANRKAPAIGKKSNNQGLNFLKKWKDQLCLLREEVFEGRTIFNGIFHQFY